MATVLARAHPSVFAKTNRGGDYAIWTIFSAALCQFLLFTWWTLDQPIVDMWGFRPAQTAVSVTYMLRQGAWLANVVPVFGEPWILTQEFPFYQWCVALSVWVTGAPLDACGRLVSAFFAVAVLWPVFLIARAVEVATALRLTLLVGALWLLAPVVVFWGRTFLIETTTAFLGLGWLAFYIRSAMRRSYIDYLACSAFGILAAVVKITAFAGFVVIGLIYTGAYMSNHRYRLSKDLLALLLALGTIILAAAALFLWGRYVDSLMIENPLTSLLRVSNIPHWYFGFLNDRWSLALWDWCIRLRDLPNTLGNAWYVAAFGLMILGLRRRQFWWCATLLMGFISGYIFFPELRIANPYYLVENAIFLCAIVAVVTNNFLRLQQYVVGYSYFAIIVVGQLWAFHSGIYGMALKDDLHKHPYYLAGLAIRAATPPDSVIVGFGMGWGADVPYFADRLGVIIPNWAPAATVRRMLFEQRDRWFGGRKLGAVIDCTVFESQRIDRNLEPIRDALKQELAGQTIEVTGSLYGADVSSPRCEIFVPQK
jgi:hypothetical protein